MLTSINYSQYKGRDSLRFDGVELVEFPMSKRELGGRGNSAVSMSLQ